MENIWDALPPKWNPYSRPPGRRAGRSSARRGTAPPPAPHLCDYATSEEVDIVIAVRVRPGVI